MSLSKMTVPGRLSWELLLLWAGLAVGCTELPAQDSGGPLLPEQAAYDVTFYDLNVSVDPANEALKGRLTVQADVVDSLDVFVLDLDRRLEVHGVRLEKEGARPSLSFDRRENGNRLWIDLPEERGPGHAVRVTVTYGGQPRVAPNPPWDGGVTWGQTPDGVPWVATSCQMAGADLWWPVKDHPSDEPDSMAVSITVPDTLVAASNGHLRGVESASDSTQTFHWQVSTSINPYGVTLNVAPYVRVDTSYGSTAGEEVPVSAYVLPSDTTRARGRLPHFLEQVRFLEETIGSYPFRADKYGIAQTPFLGMEHQTLIAYGNDFRQQGGLGYDAGFDALHFHELAHEWYGNCLTVRDWKDFWLHEGTATYLEAIYAESLRGEEAYHDLIGFFRQQVSGTSRIARRQATSAQAIYSREVYYKGALVLHTLRSMIGGDAVETLLRRFVVPNGADGPVCRHVDTDEFLRVAESISGQDLDAWAETYLYRSSLPRLDTTRTDESLRLEWTDAAESFAVPVPVDVDGTERRIPMTGGTGELSVSPDAAVRIDPEGWVLRSQ